MPRRWRSKSEGLFLSCESSIRRRFHPGFFFFPYFRGRMCIQGGSWRPGQHRFCVLQVMSGRHRSEVIPSGCVVLRSNALCPNIVHHAVCRFHADVSSSGTRGRPHSKGVSLLPVSHYTVAHIYLSTPLFTAHSLEDCSSSTYSRSWSRPPS